MPFPPIYLLRIDDGLTIAVVTEIDTAELAHDHELDEAIDAAVLDALRSDDDCGDEDSTFHLMYRPDDGLPYIEDFSGAEMEDYRQRATVTDDERSNGPTRA